MLRVRSAAVGTQRFVNATQALYQRSYIPSLPHPHPQDDDHEACDSPTFLFSLQEVWRPPREHRFKIQDILFPKMSVGGHSCGAAGNLLSHW